MLPGCDMLVNVFVCVEPVGSSAPTLSSKEKLVNEVRRAHSTFALLCSVQASPAPEHRY